MIQPRVIALAVGAWLVTGVYVVRANEQAVVEFYSR